MKKFISLLFLLVASLPAFSQHFEWVRTYTGSEVTSGVITNKLVGSCVDSAGNIYILGEFSPYAELCGERLLPSSVITTQLKHGIVIAKLSPSGELLWHKAIYNDKDHDYAHALRMVGDSAIMVMVRFCLPFDNGYSQYEKKLYYLDTLLTGNDDYLMPTDSVESPVYTAFITFDLDGNAVERHLLCVGYTDTNGNALTWRSTLGSAYTDQLRAEALSWESFNVDSEGNIYVVRQSGDAVYGQYNHSTNDFPWWRIDEGTIGALKIVVDGTHNIYYPIPYPTYIGNQQILKFSPHFDSLIDAVYVFDSALTYIPGTTEITTFDIDSRNNLYMTLYGQSVLNRLYIANSDSLILNDFSTPSWVIKYNQDLHAIGIVQLSHDGDGEPQIAISRTHIDNKTNKLFVSGRTYWFPDVTVNDVRYKDYSVNIPNKSGFWLCLTDELDLSSVGILSPTTSEGRVDGISYLETSNNRVFAQSSFDAEVAFADTIIPSPNQAGQNNRAVLIWDYNGHEIGQIELGQHSPQNGATKTHSVDSVLYLTGILREDATFDTITTHNQGSSQVYIAKYINPEFAHPYVHPSDRQEQTIEWQQNLTFSLTDSPVTLTATATSGLPVSYTCSDNTTAYIDGSTLHLLHDGTATITATQQGDYYYHPAEPISKILQVGDISINANDKTMPQVYPNPATDVVYIHTGGEPVTTVRLLSSIGRTEQVVLTDDKISIAHLPSGVYYLSIITTTNSYQYKIVKP